MHWSQKDVFDVMFHPFLLMWLGQALHFFKALKQLEDAGTRIGMVAYMKEHPYAGIFSLLAGFAAYGFLYATDELNRVAAFTAGYMADSLINGFVDRTLTHLGATADEPPTPTLVAPVGLGITGAVAPITSDSPLPPTPQKEDLTVQVLSDPSLAKLQLDPPKE